MGAASDAGGGTAEGRPPRRAAPPRDAVLAAAMAAIAREGLASLTMAALGREVGMSGSHLLYYFGTKDGLLVATLRWSEAQLGARRAELTRGPGSARQRLERVAALYLPEAPGDPRWALWVEMWGRSQGSDEIRAVQGELEAAWRADLTALLREGAAAGEFRTPLDAARHAVRLAALLDGFGTPLAIGLPDADREIALAHIREYLDDTLTPAPH